ncbi:hypothetical protein ACVIGB_000645 [Bradyrhizobium sp. USDA 4341]
MKAANGGSYGEFVVLRALKAKGGQAAFSELSAIHLKGIERIVLGMLPARSRPKEIPSKTTMRGAVRPPLIRRRFVNNAVHYHLTLAGWRGANHPGPWTVQVGDVILEWNAAAVEVFRVSGRRQLAAFSPEHLFIEATGTSKRNPDRQDWKLFQRDMLSLFRLRVPYEAMPDQLRWPPGFAA